MTNGQDILEKSERFNKYLKEHPTATIERLSTNEFVSNQWVYQVIALRELCPAARQALSEDRITIASAFHLSRFNETNQLELLSKAESLDSDDFARYCIKHGRNIRATKKKIKFREWL